jgi:hypothetical protein
VGREADYHRDMRTLVLALIAVAGLHGPARADLGIGIFVGEPLGLDLKIDLDTRSALDIVIGATTIEDGRESYGHLTYLFTLGVARGRSVVLPFRLGFGGAVYGVTEERFGLAARVPFQLGIRFRRSPLEIYGEIALRLQLFREGPGRNVDLDVDGGVGLRFYF